MKYSKTRTGELHSPTDLELKVTTDELLESFFEKFTEDRSMRELTGLLHTALASQQADAWDHRTREDKIFFIEETKQLLRDLHCIHNRQLPEDTQ